MVQYYCFRNLGDSIIRFRFNWLKNPHDTQSLKELCNPTIMSTRISSSYRYVTHYVKYVQFSSICSAFSSQKLEETIKSSILSKSYQHLPYLFNSSKDSYHNPNPFSCLSSFHHDHRVQIIDEILQAFIPFRPRFLLNNAYQCLLLYTLQGPNPLPLGLAILQSTLRSGCIPVPQILLLLSSAWLDRRTQFESVSNILMDMKSIGYTTDTGTCNYLISSLCAVDEISEAVEVLKGMIKAGCVPDLETYGTIICTMCSMRNTVGAVELTIEMVKKVGLTLRQGTVKKVMAALRANKEIWKAVDLIEFLEKEDYHVGFETYELVIDGCLECREFVLAGKVVLKMTKSGFIPYIRARQKILEGLVKVNEYELACVVRQRFAELKS